MHGLCDPPCNGAFGCDTHDEGALSREKSHSLTSDLRYGAKAAPFARGLKGPQAAFSKKNQRAKVTPFARGLKGPQAAFSKKK